LHDVVNQSATELGVGMGKIAQPIRVAVSGGTVSPPIDVTLEVLGREVTLARLERALAYAQGQG
jgi:glutamyl-tRNA synthetase